jgi:hypothetical protein
MNRQLSFQERHKAFTAWRGRFVVMHEDDDSSSSLRTPVASVAASFDTLDVANDDENSDVGVAGIGDLCVPSIAVGAASSSTNPTVAVPPRAHGMPSTIVGAASLSTMKLQPRRRQQRPRGKLPRSRAPIRLWRWDLGCALRQSICPLLSWESSHLHTVMPISV